MIDVYTEHTMYCRDTKIERKKLEVYFNTYIYFIYIIKNGVGLKIKIYIEEKKESKIEGREGGDSLF